jgi:hypothetical protein
MPRNVIRPIVYDPEPMLALVTSTPTPRTWLPEIAARAASVDTTRWQTRAAHGLSWHRAGRATRRYAH